MRFFWGKAECVQEKGMPVWNDKCFSKPVMLPETPSTSATPQRTTPKPLKLKIAPVPTPTSGSIVKDLKNRIDNSISRLGHTDRMCMEELTDVISRGLADNIYAIAAMVTSDPKAVVVDMSHLHQALATFAHKYGSHRISSATSQLYSVPLHGAVIAINLWMEKQQLRSWTKELEILWDAKTPLKEVPGIVTLLQ
jgi:hypothetical protein